MTYATYDFIDKLPNSLGLSVLLMLGGYDNMEMSKGGAAMRNEFERILPAMRSGGYIPSVDHQPHQAYHSKTIALIYIFSGSLQFGQFNRNMQSKIRETVLFKAWRHFSRNFGQPRRFGSMAKRTTIVPKDETLSINVNTGR